MQLSWVIAGRVRADVVVVGHRREGFWILDTVALVIPDAVVYAAMSGLGTAAHGLFSVGVVGLFYGTGVFLCCACCSKR